jgi:hypothetical protein
VSVYSYLLLLLLGTENIIYILREEKEFIHMNRKEELLCIWNIVVVHKFLDCGPAEKWKKERDEASLTQQQLRSLHI